MNALRDYQVAAVDATRDAYRAGKRAVLIALPTGAGKTRLASEIVRLFNAKGHPALWLAHGNELVLQANEALRRVGLQTGVVSAEYPELADPSAPVQVGSIGTVRSRIARGKPVPPARLIVCDEAHHDVAETRRAIIGAPAYTNAFQIGLTATPSRLDGKPLGDVYDHLVVAETIAGLTDRGFLVPCRVITTDPDEGYLNGNLAKDPVEVWQKHGRGRQSIVFTANVAAGEATTERLRAAGARVAWVDGKTKAAARAASVASFKAGALDTLVNCQVLTEGFDSPAAAVCILARGCMSTALYLQMVGRVLRPWPGKEYALLVDLSGCVHKHGPPWADREMSLSSGIQKLPALDAIRFCPQCGCSWAPSQDGAACPLCGWVGPPREVKSKKVLDLELKELQREFADATTPEREKKRYYHTQLVRAARRGHSPSWAGHIHRAKFGAWPPDAWLAEFAGYEHFYRNMVKRWPPSEDRLLPEVVASVEAHSAA